MLVAVDPSSTNTVLGKAAAELGQAGLAKRIGASQQKVWAWLNRGRVPEQFCPAIERAMAGRDGVTCEALRPDIEWARFPDPDWPWHPGGRPFPDYTRFQSEDVRNAA